MNRRQWLLPACLLFLAACSEEVGTPSTTGSPPPLTDPGKLLEVPVPSQGRVFVSLQEPAVVTPDGDGSTATNWDIAFEKYDAFTNSGVSGSGDGGAFGPLDIATYDEGKAPNIPFLTKDYTGGPFRDYWAYDPMVHVLWVRYHVFGIREGDKLWKLQILGYYGEVQGAPVAAIYRLRWAEVTSAGIGPTQEIADIDGTAGGSQPTDDTPSECLDLGTGVRVFHTPAEAKTTKDWHLCFRRADVNVNGELGGPRNVTAVDLHADESKNESLAILKTRTDMSELPRFDAVGLAELTNPKLVWRGDRVLSAFSDYWIEPGSNPPKPTTFSWLVSAADGVTPYLLIFDKFNGATAEGPGSIVLRIRPEGK
jgi:hypothetical protein